MCISIYTHFIFESRNLGPWNLLFSFFSPLQPQYGWCLLASLTAELGCVFFFFLKNITEVREAVPLIE